MSFSEKKITPFVTFTVDLILITVSFVVTNYLVYGKIASFNYHNFYLLFTTELVWVLILLRFNLYETPRMLYVDKLLSNNLKALLYFVVFNSAILFFVSNYKFSRSYILVFLGIFSFLLLLWRFIFYFLIKKKRIIRPILRTIVVVGVNEHISNIVNKVLTKPEFEYKVLGIFTEAKISGELLKHNLGKLNETIDYLEQNRVDEILISLPHKYSEIINKLIVYADNHMIRVNIIPEFSEYLFHSFSIDYISNVPIMKYRKEPLQSLTNRILKRGVDIVISTIIIVAVFSWLFPLLAILIKLNSKGPIFFVQERTGKDGKSFKCFKFRSMTVNDKSDSLQATKNDSRITRIGAFLRRTSLDELPQVFNVFFNNMSLVGPRPHMLKHTEEYRLLVDKFMVRHFAKPGLTGWAQIMGYRGETKTVQDMENRAYADIWYIENWNLMLDVKIMFKTAYIMLFKKEENAF